MRWGSKIRKTPYISNTTTAINIEFTHKQFVNGNGAVTHKFKEAVRIKDRVC